MIDSLRDRLADFDEITRVIALKAREERSFTIGDASSWVTAVGEQSVRSRLDALVDAGILDKIGRTKGLRYVFLDPFENIRRELNDSPE